MGQSKPFFGDLKEQLARIGKASLKPSQKVGLLKQFLIPRYLDLMQSPVITDKAQREVDKLLRMFVRRNRGTSFGGRKCDA